MFEVPSMPIWALETHQQWFVLMSCMILAKYAKHRASHLEETLTGLCALRLTDPSMSTCQELAISQLWIGCIAKTYLLKCYCNMMHAHVNTHREHLDGTYLSPPSQSSLEIDWPATNTTLIAYLPKTLSILLSRSQST